MEFINNPEAKIKCVSLLSHEVLLRQLQLGSEERAFALVQVMKTRGPTAVKSGNKAIILSDGTIEGWVGGHCTEADIVRVARESINYGTSRLLDLSTCQGGRMDVFIEPYLPRRKILIFGHVPIVLAISRFAKLLNFNVVVVDKLATKEKFPEADSILASFEGIESDDATRKTFAVVATMGESDHRLAELLIASEIPYVAIVSGKKRAREIISYLEHEGHEKRELSKIRAPAGVRIGAVSAEEIALSIMAEIVETARSDNRNSREEFDSTVSNFKSGVHDSQGRRAKSYVQTDPVCKMTVDSASRWSSRFDGKEICFCSTSCKKAFDRNPSEYVESVQGLQSSKFR